MGTVTWLQGSGRAIDPPETAMRFTFNHVFSPEESHEYLYETSAQLLVEKLYERYNVTILAYRQTGSGKT